MKSVEIDEKLTCYEDSIHILFNFCATTSRRLQTLKNSYNITTPSG